MTMGKGSCLSVLCGRDGGLISVQVVGTHY